MTGENLPPGFSVADLKARLAGVGVSVAPDARFVPLSAPRGGRINLMVVDRVADTGEPDYCVHGFVPCILCEEICYLGDATSQAVLSGDIFPICMQCASANIDPHEHRTAQLHDTRRNDPSHRPQ